MTTGHGVNTPSRNPRAGQPIPATLRANGFSTATTRPRAAPGSTRMFSTTRNALQNAQSRPRRSLRRGGIPHAPQHPLGRCAAPPASSSLHPSSAPKTFPAHPRSPRSRTPDHASAGCSHAGSPPRAPLPPALPWPAFLPPQRQTRLIPGRHLELLPHLRRLLPFPGALRHPRLAVKNTQPLKQHLVRHPPSETGVTSSRMRKPVRLRNFMRRPDGSTSGSRKAPGSP